MQLKAGIYVVSEALIHTTEFSTVIFLLCCILDRHILRISLPTNCNSLLYCSSSPIEKESRARSGMSMWGWETMCHPTGTMANLSWVSPAQKCDFLLRKGLESPRALSPRRDHFFPHPPKAQLLLPLGKGCVYYQPSLTQRSSNKLALHFVEVTPCYIFIIFSSSLFRNISKVI